MRCLKAGGFSVVGAACGDDASDLTTHEPTAGRLALVIGSETDGLSSFWKAACDALARVPASGMDSLDAAAASAVLLWELRRMRDPESDEG